MIQFFLDSSQFIISGALVGLLIGMTGVGGGSLMTPLLTIIFGVAPTTAVGTDLAFAAITKGFKVSPSLGQLGDYVYERAFVEK